LLKPKHCKRSQYRFDILPFKPILIDPQEQTNLNQTVAKKTAQKKSFSALFFSPSILQANPILKEKNTAPAESSHITPTKLL
jgi:hypothetical protein